MRYKALIFDLDGTLLDTLDDLTAATNYALSKCGFPLRTRDEVCSFVGNGMALLISRAVPKGTEKQKESEVYEAFHQYYSAHMTDQTRPYDNAQRTLSALHGEGVHIGIVSNKAHYAVCDLCEKFFKGDIDAMAGQREGVRKKPAPDAVFEVLEKIGCKPEEVVYIGDADTDIETAKNAGCDFIGVSWGFRGRSFLIAHGAETVADTFDDLNEILKNED